MPKLLLLILVCCGIHHLSAQDETKIYATRAGSVSFVSQAPLELIEAQSNLLQGAIDVAENKFAFQVNIKSLEGFNSELQLQHFNENYMESDLYPKAYFSGRFVEDNDLSVPGDYELRAKGIFFIHGKQQERIIEGKIKSTGDAITIRAYFPVVLNDHNISIPKIVNQKIAEVIEVWVDATLMLRK